MDATPREDSVRISNPAPDDYPILTSSPAYTPTSAAPQEGFMAGLAFFNYNDFGSLRPGRNAIKQWRASYVGLAVHVVLVGFVNNVFTYGYGPLLGKFLEANGQSNKLADSILTWPQTLAFLIGLSSDAFPIVGYRRKSYMVLGWVLSCILFSAIVVLDFATSEKRSNTSKLHLVYLVVGLFAGIAIQIAWTSALIASVEFAQREHIHHRGRLQATILSLYYFGGAIAKTVNVVVVPEDEAGDQSLSLGRVSIILACVSLAAIPFVVNCFDEEPITQKKTPPTPLSRRLSHFWKFCHHNVVYRVLFFVGMHMLLLGVYNENVHVAVQEYSKVSEKDSRVVSIGCVVAQIAGTLFWKQYMRNVSWRKLALWSSAVYVLLRIALTLFTTYDLVRDAWFYGVVVCVAEVPRAWIALFAVILATEIAEIGYEGMTLTLGLSFTGLAALADYFLARIFPEVFSFEVSREQIKADSPATRRGVTVALFVGVAFNLLSFALITLPPRQKLDAQQMRAFGGHNRLAGWALVLTFVVLLAFNLAANVSLML